MGWNTRESWFDSWLGQENCSLLRSIQTTAGARASYATVTGGGEGVFLKGKGPAPFHLLPNLRLCGDKTPLAHTPSQRAQVQIYLFLYFTAVERVNVNWIKLALYCIQCQCLPLSVSQIMFIAAHPPFKRGGRKSSISLSYSFDEQL